MPPRHGKSEAISRLFTAYYLYKYPDKWVGVNSYADALASTLSRNARENYKAAGGKLNPVADAVHHWETQDGGGMWAAGVGGPILGKGFHLGVIDDPVKNAEEAQSPTIREKHKDWYKSTLGTREEPDAAIVIVQQRWNEDDLSGWLLAQENDDDELSEHWHVVCMAAIKEDVDLGIPKSCTLEPDTRQAGDALCPERYNVDKLARIKRRIGTYYWNALYGQIPSPDEGGIFKKAWWRYWKPKGIKLPPVQVRLADGKLVEIEVVDLPDSFDAVVQSWDLAFKDTKTSDFVAGQVWARLEANKYLLDYRKERADISETMKMIEVMTIKWPRAITKLVEDKANGPAVITMLKSKMAGLIAVDPRGGKVSRAYAVQPEVEAGNVFLPHPLLYSWVQEFINSCAGFPNLAHDDDVDSFTQALIRWQKAPRREAEQYRA